VCPGSRPVHICVDSQLGRGGGALQVYTEVRIPGIMHMKADLLDGVGDVGVGEHHVLEGPGKAPKLSRINDRRPGSNGDLGLCVHGYQDRLAVHHASTLKVVETELALSVEESICRMLFGDPQKW
jgi:hypothetical protein